MTSSLLLAEISPEAAGRMVGRGIVLLFGLGIVVLFIVSLIKSFTRKSPGWIATCVVTGLLSGLVLLGALGSIGAKAIESHRKKAAATLKVISSDDGTVSLSVPSDWKPIVGSPNGTLLSAHQALEEKYVMVAGLSKQDFTGNLHAYQKLMATNMAEKLKDQEISEPEEGFAGDYPVMRWQVKGEVSHVQAVYHIASLETADSFYQIVTWTLKSREEANGPALDEVINSFASKAGPP